MCRQITCRRLKGEDAVLLTVLERLAPSEDDKPDFPSGNRLLTCCLYSTSFGLYLAWLGIHHDRGFLRLDSLELQALSCAAGFFGILLAGLSILMLHRRKTGLAVPCTFAFLAAQICCSVALDVSFTQGFASLSILLQSLIAMLTFIALAQIVIQISAFGLKEAAIAVGVGIGSFGIVQCMLFLLAHAFGAWGIDHIVPWVPLEDIVSFLVLVGAFFSLRAVSSSGELVAAWRLENLKFQKIPWQIVFHGMSYFVVFGVTHVLASGILPHSDQKLLPCFLGAGLAAVLLLVLFGGKNSDLRLWPKIRNIVFPATVIGFVLLPMSEINGAFVSVFITEGSFLVYCGFFSLGSIVVARKTSVNIHYIVAVGMILSSAALTAGSIVGNIIKATVVFDSFVYSLITVVAFALLTASTLWIGDDKEAAMVWGMERKLPPKRFNELMLAKKTGVLAHRHSLTRRESEVLLLLAQGCTPLAIAHDESISLNTVRTHIAHIHRKLDIHNQEELADLLKRTEV